MRRQECYWWQECAASVITSVRENNWCWRVVNPVLIYAGEWRILYYHILLCEWQGTVLIEEEAGEIESHTLKPGFLLRTFNTTNYTLLHSFLSMSFCISSVRLLVHRNIILQHSRPRSMAEMVQILTSKFYSANKSPVFLLC